MSSLTEWPKRCSSCNKLISKPSWSSLPSLGVMTGIDLSIDLKNCPVCGSTLAVPVKEKKG